MVLKISKFLILYIVICIQSFFAVAYAAEPITLAYNLDGNEKPTINKLYYGSLKRAPIDLNELSQSKPRRANKSKAISTKAIKKEDYDFKIGSIKKEAELAESGMPFFGGVMLLPKNKADFGQGSSDGVFKSLVLGVLFPISQATYLELAYKYFTYEEDRTFIQSGTRVIKFSNVSNYYSGLSLTYLLKYSFNNDLFLFGGAGLSYNSYKMNLSENSPIDVTFHENSKFSPAMKLGVNYNNFELAYNYFGESSISYEDNEYKIETTGFTLVYHFRF